MITHKKAKRASALVRKIRPDASALQERLQMLEELHMRMRRALKVKHTDQACRSGSDHSRTNALWCLFLRKTDLISMSLMLQRLLLCGFRQALVC